MHGHLSRDEVGSLAWLNAIDTRRLLNLTGSRAAAFSHVEVYNRARNLLGNSIRNPAQVERKQESVGLGAFFRRAVFAAVMVIRAVATILVGHIPLEAGRASFLRHSDQFIRESLSVAAYRAHEVRLLIRSAPNPSIGGITAPFQLMRHSGCSSATRLELAANLGQNHKPILMPLAFNCALMAVL